MAPNPYQDIAKEFMDLWQKQMSSVVGDKQFIHAMLDMFKNMQAQPNAKQDTTANTSNTSSAEHGMLTELSFRLAMCEKRLAALENQGAAAGKTARRSRAGSKKPNK